MEKPYSSLEKATKKWVQEAGLEQPSAAFSANVMKAISEKKKISTAYQPLITKRGWLVVVGVFVLSVLLLLFIPTSEFSLFDSLQTPQLPAFNNPFDNWKVSKTFVYAIGFLLLFLVQIPFLKRRFIN